MLLQYALLAALLLMFARATAQDSCFQQITDAHVLCIEEDAEKFYVGTYDRGLVEYNRVTLESTTYDSANSALDSYTIRALQMHNGMLYVSTDSSLYVLQNNELQLVNDSLSGELAIAQNGNLIVAANMMYYELSNNTIVYSKNLLDLVNFACDMCETTTDLVVAPDGDVWISHFSFYEFDVLQYDGIVWTLHDIRTTEGVLPIESWNPYNRLMWWSNTVFASAFSVYTYAENEGMWTHQGAELIVNHLGDTLKQAVTDMESYFDGSYWVGTYQGFETQDSKSEAGSIAYYDGSNWIFTQLPTDSAAAVVRLRVSTILNGALFVATTHGLYLADTKCLSFPTSVDEEEPSPGLTQRVNIYPNPTQGVVRFTAPITGTLEIWNTSGTRVAFVERGTWSSIDLSDLPKGVYVVHIRSAVESHQYKVVLQ